jgi:hypothetical protein
MENGYYETRNFVIYKSQYYYSGEIKKGYDGLNIQLR